MSHSAGPFEIFGAPDRVYLMTSKTQLDVAEFRWGVLFRPREEAIANAHLFMAAASLLAACKGLAALDRTPDRFASPELLAARAAIKEAEEQS